MMLHSFLGGGIGGKPCCLERIELSLLDLVICILELGILLEIRLTIDSSCNAWSQADHCTLMTVLLSLHMRNLDGCYSSC